MEIVDKKDINYKKIFSFIKNENIIEEEFYLLLTNYAIENKIPRKELMNIIFIIYSTEDINDKFYDYFSNYLTDLNGDVYGNNIIKLYGDTENNEELNEFIISCAYFKLKYYVKNWRELDYKTENPKYIKYPYYWVNDVKPLL